MIDVLTNSLLSTSRLFQGIQLIMEDLRRGNRQRKKTNKDFFSPGHKVRATGKALAARVSKKSSSDFVIQALKPSPDADVGVGLKDFPCKDSENGRAVEVDYIDPNSLFTGSDLSVGMKIKTINGIRCASAVGGQDLLEMAEKKHHFGHESGRA